MTCNDANMLDSWEALLQLATNIGDRVERGELPPQDDNGQYVLAVQHLT